MNEDLVNKEYDELLLDLYSDKYAIIIGSGALLKDEYAEGDVNRHILEELGRQKGRKYQHFNQLGSIDNDGDEGRENHPLQQLLTRNNEFFSVEKIRPSIIEFLKRQPSRIILTTTIDSFITNALVQAWGVNSFDIIQDFEVFCDRLKRHRFGKDTNEKGVLFYVFGKAEKLRNTPHNYVATDDDAINYVMMWIDRMKNRDNEFVSYMKNRKIFALGCKYNDWYFRFFWQILNNNKPNQGQIVFNLDTEDKEEKKLKYYIDKKYGISHHNDVEVFLNEINDRLRDAELWKSIKRLRKNDIFISYKSCNIKDAQKLFAKLKEEDLRVWLDETGLIESYNYNITIAEAIDDAPIFLVLLTPDIEKDTESMEHTFLTRYYVAEWKKARQWNESNASKQKKIIPIAINGYMMGNDSKSYQWFEENIGPFHGYDLFNNVNDWENLLNDIKGTLNKNEKIQ